MYEIQFTKFLCVCNPASILCNMNKLLSGGVPTRVRYYYSPMLCRLFLCTCHLLSRPHASQCCIDPFPLPTAILMRSSVHIGVAHCPHSIPLLSAVDPYVFLCPRLRHAFCEASTSVSLRTSYRSLCLHQGILCLPPPTNPFSCAHPSKIGWRSFHFAIVPCLRTIYVAALCIPSTLNTSPAVGFSHVLFVVLCVLFPIICLSNTTFVPSTVLNIASNMAHYSEPKNITACITAR